MRPSTDLERAYAAGFFDGEGCVQIARYHARIRREGWCEGETWAARASIVQTSFQVLRELAGIWGGRPTSYQPQDRQLYWTWSLQARQMVVRFLSEILPYLKVKGPQATLALEWLRLPREHRFAVAVATKEAMSNLNARGADAAARKGVVLLFEPSPQLELLENA